VHGTITADGDRWLAYVRLGDSPAAHPSSSSAGSPRSRRRRWRPTPTRCGPRGDPRRLADRSATPLLFADIGQAHDHSALVGEEDNDGSSLGVPVRCVRDGGRAWRTCSGSNLRSRASTRFCCRRWWRGWDLPRHFHQRKQRPPRRKPERQSFVRRRSSSGRLCVPSEVRRVQ
jgi:hypothetical protein